MTSIMSDVIAGRIELLDPLARGASGSLWRAIDRRYGAVCAAKVMRQRDGADVLRFVREQTVGTAQGLGQHPHLLPPYTWVAEDDTIVLVMPLVHGGTLAEALATHGALSPSLVAHLLRQLLDALATMHEARWVHRDLKPANLLLDGTGVEAPHLLLADFGIALHESDVRLTETGFAHGTPGFMAPEVLDGGLTSFAQDVWAAAACAVEALAPLPRRQRSVPSELPERMDRALAGSADPAAPHLAELLRAMLSLDPDRRPTAASSRDTIPRFLTPAAQWSLTAAGERFEVVDQIETAGAQLEVPLDGPATLAGLAPGLHERLHALSSGHSAASPDVAPGASPAVATAVSPDVAPGASPSAAPGDAQHHPVAPAGGSGFLSTSTELFVAQPTHRRDTALPGTPTPRRRSTTVIGVVLLVLALASLGGAGALLWTALG